jgi:hypothetical protein
MTRLAAALRQQFKESTRLEAEIRKHPAGPGHDLENHA